MSRCGPPLGGETPEITLTFWRGGGPPEKDRTRKPNGGKKRNDMRRPRSSHVAALCALTCMFTMAPPGARALPPDASRPAAARQEGPIRLRFANTDVSDVLQALSLQTRANIVYPAQLKKPISLNINVPTVEEALSYVTAAAGLAWRKVGSTYVVA